MVVAVAVETRLHVGAQAHVQPNYNHTCNPLTNSRSFPGTILKDLRSVHEVQLDIGHCNYPDLEP